MVKQLFISVMLLFFCFELAGQTDSILNEKPFKKIKKFIIRKNREEKDSIEITKVTINDSVSLNNLKSEITYKVLPTLSSDKNGFSELDLKPYTLNTKIAEQEKYIVFEFVVNEKGYVTEFISHETNESKLTYALLDKLKNTFWNAAENINGEKVEYNFGKWIVKVPLNAALRDYEMDRD